ncbi:hypothetical protein ACFOOM_32600 [Streptomyces echinoruber]|uniref:hypothetical protein n=1 Tax=Streptomyces echinoruber TaxID=68898 RepID=UPI00167D5595|nr:hypothetical protein [Streptomyces echinoruber]
MAEFAFVPPAMADPLCYIPTVCEVRAAVDFATDPLGFLLQKLTEANIWFLRKMLALVDDTTRIDLTGSGFLKQYALVFAASSLITTALWFVAVAKRAVRGVPVVEAVGEAIGFLLLQYVVNALTPGAIALLLKATDEVTAVFEPYATRNLQPFLETLLKVMAADPSEGVGQLLVVNLVMLCGALLVWIEMLIRSAAIYVGVALGPVVNAGLVDRDLWGKSKKWFAALFAIALSKPVLLALLGLGAAILSDSTGRLSDAVSKTLVGALILLIAVFASGTLYRWVPVFGDEMVRLHHDRKAVQSAGPASVVDGPAQHANRVIGLRVQDSLVRGGTGPSGSGGTPSGAAGKGVRASTVSSRAGAASTRAAAGSAAVGAAAAKAGADLVKRKAEDSPGMQGAETANGGNRRPGGGTSAAPATARGRGADSDPAVGSGTGLPSAAGTGTPTGTPAGVRHPAGGAAPVVRPVPADATAPAASGPPAPARPAPPVPPPGSSTAPRQPGDAPSVASPTGKDS